MSDEPEFTAADVAELLASVPDPAIVVVGGQAVNALAELYAAVDPALASGVPFTSKDLDVFASRGELLRWEQVLGDRATVQLPDPNHMGAVQNGILYFGMADGRRLKVDFMTSVYGLKDAAVEGSAVPVEIVAAEPVRVSILNPVHCVESRTANVIGLPHLYDNPHGLKQLRASIVACRHALTEMATANTRRALNHVESLFHVACHRRAVRLYREKGIDVFEGIPSFELLPSEFREKRHPQMITALAMKRRKGRA